MSKSDAAAAKEQRLAAKLRENLKRRKDQARARAARDDAPAPEADTVKKP
ncbi:hypothetical protein SAMN05216456_2564 [Devosia crocina]|uniref:Uncharacterized protein n=1 Tax=Devosia crocina TaxID=429728 RepID=A0A1I7NPG8_9HYPH|nr:hypothetical protein [Devosia crocina]SFV36574.1 hypothetical protein SAMN05216456_2564 [Devosia crocina]